MERIISYLPERPRCEPCNCDDDAELCSCARDDSGFPCLSMFCNNGMATCANENRNPNNIIAIQDPNNPEDVYAPPPILTLIGTHHTHEKPTRTGMRSSSITRMAATPATSISFDP